jgi:HSP20 family molecular chaperone IbpA|tara:strand:+ start:3007 stop:3135 length:129 start_codon:yes stop_codon:yes gene_type:complete
MPENADFETMTSSFADGTLTIDVKKLAVLPTAAPKARRIPIA